MDRKHIIIIAAVVVIIVAAFFIFRGTPLQRVQRESLQWESLFQCRACGAVYHTDNATLNRLIRQGRTVEPEDDFRLFECEECGEIQATLHHDTPRELPD